MLIKQAPHLQQLEDKTQLREGWVSCGGWIPPPEGRYVLLALLGGGGGCTLIQFLCGAL